MTSLRTPDSNIYAVMWKQYLNNHDIQAWRAVAAEKVAGHWGYTKEADKALCTDMDTAQAVVKEIHAAYGHHNELSIITVQPGRIEKIVEISWKIDRDPARMAILGRRISHANR